MTSVIDTNIFIASFFRDEVHHESAKRIIQKIEKENAIYSDYILAETLNWIRNKKGLNISVQALDSIIESKIKLIKIEERHILSATELFRKYEDLSFTDCTTIALMFDIGIKQIYSFDSDFDSIPNVIRLEE